MKNIGTVYTTDSLIGNVKYAGVPNLILPLAKGTKWLNRKSVLGHFSSVQFV